jgi:hypothetical protein
VLKTQVQQKKKKKKKTEKKLTTSRHLQILKLYDLGG